jgi:BirA family biotin operon repressor/biotin-[acetyl-CoA-carboxylase] ligase
MGEVASVMDLSWALVKEGRFPAFSSVVAVSQKRGRGRYGREWLSPPGHLYASLMLPPGFPYTGTLAPIAVAYELSLALEAEFGIKTQVKWPNDLICDDHKAGGILLENKNGSIVAGIGINLENPPFLERVPGAPPPGALPWGGGPRPLWEKLAKSVFIRYTPLNREPGPAPAASYVRDVEGRLYALGRQVRLLKASSTLADGYSDLSGTLQGLDPSGSLILQTPGGRVAALSGTLVLP